jgi:hypothetical protein
MIGWFGGMAASRWQVLLRSRVYEKKKPQLSRKAVRFACMSLSLFT